MPYINLVRAISYAGRLRHCRTKAHCREMRSPTFHLRRNRKTPAAKAREYCEDE
ncbi:hypothetical protein [Anabaena subtropica]|uniref:Uncharacterized protein n=1 Tax=Anabaena subtropica FACHB-260 TaxID=2692884 RepID=A0ABR8CR33_9NOST|nr:hypothetical protein [Anabaena subtropica]MBD2345662.1 hypothetical protein [Anabaena subtropica FACHB-260]